MSHPINITEAQVTALAAIGDAEGRGRQGHEGEGLDSRVLRNLVQNGLAGTRERWGRTFYFLTRDGRRLVAGD